MKCIIVVNAYIKNINQISQAQRICEELTNLGVECEIIKNLSLAEICNGNIKAIEADVCVFLDKDRIAALMLEKFGIKLFNSTRSIEICDDKMLTHVMLANNEIAMPDSIYAPLCYYYDAKINDDFLKRVEKLDYPLVAKKSFGSLGEGVSLIRDFNELKKYEDDNKLYPHFYQRFIGNGGEDIRVIVIGGKCVCAMKRTNKSDFRSNIGLGGHGENYIADYDLIELCEKTARILNLDYCGIDILTDNDGRRYVCEVNSNAFFAEAERVCGVNIAKKYAEHILKSI